MPFDPHMPVSISLKEKYVHVLGRPVFYEYLKW